jgi:hypothetical protein
MKTAFVLLVLCVLGCSARLPPKNAVFNDAKMILRDGTDFELMSIDPVTSDCLGSTVVKNQDLQKQIAESIFDAMIENPITANCFEPRHSIKVKFDGRIYVLVICFECSQLQWWCGTEYHTYPISNKPQTFLDEVLTKANIPLAMKAKSSKGE